MRVTVVPPDPEWARKYRLEAEIVGRALAPVATAVHHIGSTAIPDIHAKPIVDMLVEVSSLDGVDDCVRAMEHVGYESMGEFGIDGRRYFRKDDANGAREYQVHAFAAGSPDVERHIAFRDLLRSRPDLARQYSDLKRSLAMQYPNDMNAYMDGKDAFIRQTERLALDQLHSGDA